MGHNKAGQRRKNRLKRNKKEINRLLQMDSFMLKPRSHIWAYIGPAHLGNHLFYTPDEPDAPYKVKVIIPETASFSTAMLYIWSHQQEVDKLVMEGLGKIKGFSPELLQKFP